MDLEGSGFHIIKLLGKGTFGKVFLAQTPNNHRDPVCVKQIVMQDPVKEINVIREEVYIISQLKHPRIIKFLQSFIQGNIVNIIMEYAPGGTMRTVIENQLKKPLTNSELLAYFCDILSGLEYLHIRHVIHRDLKPENILLDKNNRVKIADFGIALIHSGHAQNMNTFGTPYYLAPEIFRGYRWEFKVDVWSLGCILYEMCSGSSPFGFANTISELKTMLLRNSSAFYDCKKLDLYYGKMWARLCERMLTYDRAQRISLPEIVKFHSSITLYFYNLYFDYSY